MSQENSRRDLLKLSAATAASLALSRLGLADSAAELPAGPETTWKDGLPYRKFGRTDRLVSLLGVGGYHIGNLPDPDACTRFVRTAVDRGLTFMDNCWDYHDGKSEVWMGQALKDGYRDKVFLMTKIDGHSKAVAAKQIDESLTPLGTDHVDLMQHHEVVRPTDPEKIFADGGAHEAMLEAKQAGKLLHIGFTGHKDPAIHLAMLDLCIKNNYPLDAVQMPLNVLDAHFKSFANQVLPVLLKNNIAPLAMKTFAAGGIVKRKIATPVECLHYAMTLPTAVVISGMDSMEILEQNLAAARSFKPLAAEQLTALLARTRPMAEGGKFEGFKTSNNYDGTARNPEWIG